MQFAYLDFVIPNKMQQVLLRWLILSTQLKLRLSLEKEIYGFKPWQVIPLVIIKQTPTPFMFEQRQTLWSSLDTKDNNNKELRMTFVLWEMKYSLRPTSTNYNNVA